MCKKELDSDYKEEHVKKKHLLVENVTFTPVTTILAVLTTLSFIEPIVKKQNIENIPDRAEIGGNIGISEVLCQLPIIVSQKKDNVILSPGQ